MSAGGEMAAKNRRGRKKEFGVRAVTDGGDQQSIPVCRLLQAKAALHQRLMHGQQDEPILVAGKLRHRGFIRQVALQDRSSLRQPR